MALTAFPQQRVIPSFLHRNPGPEAKVTDGRHLVPAWDRIQGPAVAAPWVRIPQLQDNHSAQLASALAINGGVTMSRAGSGTLIILGTLTRVWIPSYCRRRNQEGSIPARRSASIGEVSFTSRSRGANLRHGCIGLAYESSTSGSDSRSAVASTLPQCR